MMSKPFNHDAGCGRSIAHELWVALIALTLCSSALGQQSLLDLGEADESSPKSKEAPSTEAPVAEQPPGEAPSSGEEAPLGLPPPVVSSGGGSLDDLLGDVQEKVEIESELVCDLIRERRGDGSERTLRVQLLRDFWKLPLKAGRTIDIVRLTDDGKAFKGQIKSEDIGSVLYYEDRMLQRVATELHEPRQQVTNFSDYMDLAHPERLQRAIRAGVLLTTALEEHNSARARLAREGDEWDDVRDRLAQALFRIEISRVKLHVDNDQVQQATAACDRLLLQKDLGAGARKLIQELFEAMLLDPALSALEQGDYTSAGAALTAFETRYPSVRSDLAMSLRDRLIATAEKVVEQAKAEKNPKLLDDAMRIWPQLSGLENLRSQMVTEYPVLHCAYGNLPRTFSPLRARTAVERHAAALIFDSLVRWQEDSPAGPHYASLLASTRPLPLAKGREFWLPKAHWSDSDSADPHYCTAEDLKTTFRLMKMVRPSGYSAAWSDMVTDVQEANADPFQVAIMLKHDHWQPLSMMDFPILPKESFPDGGTAQELAQFERQPVGTGPYQLLDPGGNGRHVRFVANPHYREPGRPFIREIQFEQLDSIEAKDQFLAGDIHLIYGVRPEHVDELRKLGQTIVKLPAQGVTFLAPNYRQREMQNTDLRLAIAHAIDRKILLNNFRPNSGPTDHAVLNGPFPVKSWAFNPQVPDYTTGSVAVHLGNAVTALGPLPKLHLIYPSADPEIGEVCVEIKRQLGVIGIELELEAVEPNVFVKRVVDQHGFQLAYWRHDFKDSTYWLAPLFNPQDSNPGGANFMGYVPEPELRDLFARLMLHKKFPMIQKTTHDIHNYISRNAVVIPLWELETYVAVGKTLQDTKFSATTLFEDVASWKLRPE